VNVARAGYQGRIELEKVDAKVSGLPRGAFDVVMSNSIVHHIPDPRRAFADMLGLRKRGGLLFVRDLERPADDAAVRALVERHAGHEAARARALFEASLHAAFTIDEVAAMVAPFGIPASAITRTSDRHWTLADRG
jgi:SAM-dependent methyltransferase